MPVDTLTGRIYPYFQALGHMNGVQEGDAGVLIAIILPGNFSSRDYTVGWGIMYYLLAAYLR